MDHHPDSLASVLSKLGLRRRLDGDLMSLPNFFAILKGQLIDITAEYLKLGVEYHNLAPGAPLGEGPTDALLHFQQLRIYFTDRVTGSSDGRPLFPDRLASLHAAFPRFAAAGEEPDNEQGDKRRWLTACDKELSRLKVELVAAEHHLQIMRGTFSAIGGDVTALMDGFAMDKESWEAKIKELDLAKWWIAETEEGAGDAMEEKKMEES
ncbi:hypothetical protein TI39_contig278g00056 [Zymoseptoria brevis]|uniref:Uncharacterized protein n=1 Tax=Zymoseptoria brevis TaxID=1047168 RepID=A0A0F4GWQ3_9PEZI|nr:hypothetical protein TI39_contig278g00056 [Zymoseptoria brevis]